MRRTEWERGKPWEEPGANRRFAEQDRSSQPEGGYGTALLIAAALVAIWLLHACVPALAG